MSKTITLLLFLFLSNTLIAQQYRYVTAENGLIVRANPDKNSVRNGKLPYGTRVRLVQETTIELEIKDGDKLILGKWVEIREIDGPLNGFVFSGYLTETELKKRFEIPFQDFTLAMELDVWQENNAIKSSYQDSAKIYVELGDSPLGKEIKIKQTKFKKIELFQRHENSVSIMNEGPHCDLTEWKHYYSEWIQLPFNNTTNTYLSTTYSPEDWGKFIPVDMAKLKKAVEAHCGGYWPSLLDNTKNINDYPIGISISRIFLKIVLTDKNGNVNEKTVSFEIPMGC